MITLEQIRLLESRITRAIDLIRVLKEENSTLRKGLESAQKRMKELESLVEGFKTDQQEIETVILRTLHSLDELEEGASARRPNRGASASAPGSVSAATSASPASSAPPAAEAAATRPRGAADAALPGERGQRDGAPDGDQRTTDQELDIF
jgi:peptidoglycan hydrolase CwlO-like protein